MRRTHPKSSRGWGGYVQESQLKVRSPSGLMESQSNGGLTTRPNHNILIYETLATSPIDEHTPHLTPLCVSLSLSHFDWHRVQRFQLPRRVPTTMALLSAHAMEIAIPVSAVIGIAFSLWQWRLGSRNSDNRNNEEQRSAQQMDVEDQQPSAERISDEEKHTLIKENVSAGVKSFLLTEYQYAGVFVVAFAILIFLLLGSIESFSTQSRPCKFDPSNTCKPALVTAVFSTVSFLLGAFTSVLFGSLGTKIAICANASTVLDESDNPQTTFRSGPVMGILLAAIDLLVLYLVINLFKLFYGNDWEGLFEAITGYVLGGSSMALFGRASGGIYAKAADVCVRLVKVIHQNSDQDVITTYVGDIVGDIAGMGPDRFSSYAESSCAALVLASISSFGIEHNFTAMCYPLIISSLGILVCLITTVWGEIKPASKKEQFIISTILMTVGIFVVSLIALPSSFTIYNIGSPKVVKNWQLSLCVAVGLWTGQVSGFVKKYCANNICCSLRNNAADNSCPCLQYVAPNNFHNILQVALENISVALGFVTIPFLAAVNIFLSHHFAATYGIAVAALGMLSTTATRLAIDASGPISDNTERIGKMALQGVREDAGNATAAIGKGFAIESAALVTIALLGAFVNRPAMSSSVDVLTPTVIIGLFMGTWLPYCFSAMTMKSVAPAAIEMALMVHEHIQDLRGPINATCPKILAEASFRGMIGPTALVMLTPLIIGTVFGVEMLSGLLAGSLSSVVQIAISASKTDGAWDQAKVDIKAGALKHARTLPEVSWLRSAAESTAAIGDPQKDTSGPPLNILIQLMAVESLVFAPFFATHGGLLLKFL